jgi:hypothetical protein
LRIYSALLLGTLHLVKDQLDRWRTRPAVIPRVHSRVERVVRARSGAGPGVVRMGGSVAHQLRSARRVSDLDVVIDRRGNRGPCNCPRAANERRSEIGGRSRQARVARRGCWRGGSRGRRSGSCGPRARVLAAGASPGDNGQDQDRLKPHSNHTDTPEECQAQRSYLAKSVKRRAMVWIWDLRFRRPPISSVSQAYRRHQHPALLRRA